MSLIEEFVGKAFAIQKTGAATEHSYRPTLEALVNSLTDGVTAINEPKRVACGAPDFIVQRGAIVIGHIEAKDIGVSLNKLGHGDQGQCHPQRVHRGLPRR